MEATDNQPRCGFGTYSRRGESTEGKIISALMPDERTNRSKDIKASALEVRSSSVISGHINLEPGLYRTDAPTTTRLAMITAGTITMILRLDIETIDVQIVFLNEMASTRKTIQLTTRRLARSEVP